MWGMGDTRIVGFRFFFVIKKSDYIDDLMGSALGYIFEKGIGLGG